LLELEVIVIVVCVIFAARVLESIMGFGGTVLALPILAILTPILDIKSTLVPVLALGNIVCCIGIVWVGRKDLVWSELKAILAWMAIGLPIGFLVAGYASEVSLRFVLGLFVLAVAVAYLIRRENAEVLQEQSESPLVRAYRRVILILAGVVHGMFTTGGPLLVVYAARALRTKGLFRVTLAMVWLILNIVMVSGWIADSRIAAQAWPLAGITIPFIIGAVVVGDHFHHRLPEATFRKAAYVLLLIAGISLIWKSLPVLLGIAPLA